MFEIWRKSCYFTGSLLAYKLVRPTTPDLARTKSFDFAGSSAVERTLWVETEVDLRADIYYFIKAQRTLDASWFFECERTLWVELLS